MSLTFPALTGEFFTITATWEAPRAVMSIECISMDDTHTHTQILFISRWTNQSMQLLNCDWYVCVCVCVCVHIMWHTDPFYSSWIGYLETSLFQYFARRSKAARKDILYYYSEIWRTAGFIERKVNPSKCVLNSIIFHFPPNRLPPTFEH